MSKCDSCNKTTNEEMYWYGDGEFCSLECFDNWVFRYIGGKNVK